MTSDVKRVTVTVARPLKFGAMKQAALATSAREAQLDVVFTDTEIEFHYVVWDETHGKHCEKYVDDFCERTTAIRLREKR